VSEGFTPRTRQEATLFALTRGVISGRGYCFAPMSSDSVRLVADIFRRSKARRRRGASTKAARRARFRHFVNVLAPAQADVRRSPAKASAPR